MTDDATGDITVWLTDPAYVTYYGYIQEQSPDYSKDHKMAAGPR